MGFVILFLVDFQTHHSSCLSWKPFAGEKSPDANLLRNEAETKVGVVLKTSRHLWTPGVYFYIYTSILEIFDTKVGQYSILKKIMSSEIP